MELKDFIEKTVSAVLDATEELQRTRSDSGAIINPPISNGGELIYSEESLSHVHRRIELIDFDLAVTVSSESEGGGGAGIKILGANIGAKGKVGSHSEEVSRVKFAVPVALNPSSNEADNRRKSEENSTLRRRHSDNSRKSSWGP